MSDLKELIEREMESFIEWDGDDKSIVTTTSAKLFAEHVAGLWADHVAGARNMVAAVQGEPEYGSTPQYINDAIDNLAHANYELSYGGYQERTRDVELIRAYVARAAQPAEQQPDATQLVEAASAALDEIEAIMHEAHNSAEPVCCGREGSECCGSPEPEWSEFDQNTMDRLAPHQRALTAALAAYRKGGDA